MLLEVAVCIMAYMCVLWIEVSPAILERSATRAAARAKSVLAAAWPVLEPMPFIIALGLVLPTMHQSSLGT